MAAINAFATLVTLTVEENGSTESIALKRTRDGTIYFVDTQSGAGNRVIADSSNDLAKRLFDELAALT